MRSVDPRAPTEENEPVRVPGRTVPRGVVADVAAGVFVLTLLSVVGVAVLMSAIRR